MKVSLVVICLLQVFSLQSQYHITYSSAPSYSSLNNAECLAAEDNYLHVVYTEGTLAHEEVHYVRQNISLEKWENDKVLSINHQGAFPTVVVLQNVVHVVYMETPGYGGALHYVRSKDNGLTWESPIDLSFNVGESAYPSLAISGQTLHLVWQYLDGPNSAIYYKKSEDGGNTWTDDRILTDDTRHGISPCIAVHQSIVHLLWKDNEGIQYLKSNDAGNTWSDPQPLSGHEYTMHPSIHVNDNIVIAMWSDTLFGQGVLAINRSVDHGGTWSGQTEPVDHFNRPFSPRMSSLGNFYYLVWTEMVGNSWLTIESHSSDGGLSWTDPRAISYNQGFEIKPFVLVHDQDVHMIYTDKGFSGGNQEIGYYKKESVIPFAGNNTYKWGHGIGAGFDDLAQDVVTDAVGNVYITGGFSKTVDFDPGPGTQNLAFSTGWDIFLAKYDSTGVLLWVRGAGGMNHDLSNALVLDSYGNVYATGYFSSSTDFDPGPSTFQLTPAGETDVFILKLDANGNFIWARSLGGQATDLATSIDIDSAGRIITVGSFTEVADFDPGNGVVNLTSNGLIDIFISVLDQDGHFVLAQSIGGRDRDQAESVEVDAENSIIVTGFFEDTVDFDFGSGVQLQETHGLRDLFVLKLNMNGSIQWSVAPGSTGSDSGQGIALDNDGNILVTGHYSKTIDMDPGPAVVNIVSNGNGGAFVLKLDRNGQYVWTIGYEAANGSGYDIALDELQNVYFTGAFPFLRMPPDYPNEYVYAYDDDDVFIIKLNSDGKFVWFNQLIGDIYANGAGITMYGLTDIYTTGHFHASIDLDPTTGVDLESTPTADDRQIFLGKIRQCAPRFVTISETACDQYIAPDGLTVWTTSGTYQDIIITKAGCDSVITIHLTILNSTSFEEIISVCDHFISPSGQSWNTSGTYIETLSNSLGCDSTVTYHLTILSSTNTEQMIAACNSYTTPDGLHTWTTSGTYNNTLINAAGCDSLVVYEVSIHQSQTHAYSITTCDSYTTPDGTQVYTASGVYSYSLQTVNGCDSSITVDLNITPLDLTISQTGSTLTANHPGGVYQWIDCNTGDIIPGETSQSYHPATNGSYAVVIGGNGCIDTTVCTDVMTVGMGTTSPFDEILIFPNPTHDNIIIELNKAYPKTFIEISDMLGHILFAEHYAYTPTITLQPGLMGGVYLIKVRVAGNEKVFKMLVE